MSTELTHWKKNIDSRYIAGEDLQAELHGLKKEMVVTITGFNDTDTFDQAKNEKRIATGLFLKDQNGQAVYKPVILNKTNAKFFIKETGSEFIDNWVGIPVVMYAQKDSRHGYVVRFKKYVMPQLFKDTEQFEKAHTAIHKSGFTMDQIRKKYQVSSEVEKLLLIPPANG
jgi:hypothetical protein